MDMRNFFGLPSSIINANNSNSQLRDVHNRTQYLYATALSLEPDQIEREIDGIVSSAREMVRRRREELNTSNTGNTGNTGTQILQRLNVIRDRVQTQMVQGPPPMRTAPQIVPVRPQAELRPATTIPVTRQELVQILRETRTRREPRAVIPVDWNIPKRSSHFKKLKVVSAAEINTENECGVCFDSHTKDKILTTECNHKYCITCWSSWMRNSQSNKKCPTCRTLCPPVTYYKVKVTRPRAPRQAVTTA